MLRLEEVTFHLHERFDFEDLVAFMKLVVLDTDFEVVGTIVFAYS